MNRVWCALVEYPSKKPFLFGNLSMPHDAKDHEVRAEMVRTIVAHMPPGFEVKELLSGQVVFHPHEI